MSTAFGAVLSGVDGVAVEVEVRISAALPGIEIVGRAEAAVRESAARVRSALAAVDHPVPSQRVTVNLAPASVRKTDAGLDLPIAVGILAAAGAVPDDALAGLGFVGELALDGRLRPVRGTLALALALRDQGCRRLLVSEPSAAEAALTPGVEVRAAPDLEASIDFLRGEGELKRARPAAPRADAATALDLADVRGQETARRALEIAAAGGHGLLLGGPPGSGKTMLARRLPGLLPPLPFEEALEATRIHGAAGRLAPGAPILVERPFRAPHHSASRAGLLGGGSPPRPGEVSLAHRGVLFLDELPEFERRALESLRQVLEDRRVIIARAHGTVQFPAHFQLVAAANPCKCGWRGSGARECTCSDAEAARYLSRISGPLLDRIDLHVRVPPVAWKELDAGRAGESSEAVRGRVVAARERQRFRLSRFGVATNAEIPDAALDEAVAATPDARALLGRAVDRLHLSARGARRLLRVARTIADLAGAPAVRADAMAEAIGYRPTDPT